MNKRSSRSHKKDITADKQIMPGKTAYEKDWHSFREEANQAAFVNYSSILKKHKQGLVGKAVI